MALDFTTPAEALTEAGTLFAGLITGLPNIPTFPEPPEVVIPDVPALPAELTGEITQMDVDELTEGAVSAHGVFDKIMASVNTHIESQYFKGILGKSEVASVYIAAIQTALPQAAQFMLASQQSYWQAKLIQIQAQNAFLERTRLIAELQTAKLVAFRAQAEAYAAQVGAITAQTVYANGKLQLVRTLQEINTSETQEALIVEQYNSAYIDTHSTLPGGGAVGGMKAKDLELKDEQISLAQSQQTLIASQNDVQRAQTRDTNADSTTVAGIIGVQKDLYNEQIQSYIKDAKNKGVKLLADAWSTAKALDDAVQSPGPLAANFMLAANKYLNDIDLPNAMVNADTPGTGAASSDTDWDAPGRQT